MDSAKPGKHETVVAAGRVPGDAAGLQQRDRPAAPRELARRGQPGKAAADDADVDVEIEGQPAARMAVGTMVAVYQVGP